MAARSMASLVGSGAEGIGKGEPVAPFSPQATSAGTMRVAICPGGVRAPTMASVASRPICDDADEVRSHLEYGRAMPSMSERQRRVVMKMKSRVLADDIDDRHACSVGVVQIGEPVT